MSARKRNPQNGDKKNVLNAYETNLGVNK